AAVTADTVRVRDAAGNFLTPATFQLRDDDRLAQLTFAALVAGDYQIVVSGAVTDRAGNALSASDVISPFTLTPRASLSTTAADQYQLHIVQAGLTDRAGNALGTGAFTTGFRVEQFLTSPDFYPFGTRLFLGDDQTVDIGPMPFAFSYFGTPNTGHIFVSSNG